MLLYTRAGDGGRFTVRFTVGGPRFGVKSPRADRENTVFHRVRTVISR